MNVSLFIFFNSLHSPALDGVMNLGTWLGSFWNMPWILLGLAVLYVSCRVKGTGHGTLSAGRVGRLLAILLLGYVLTGLMVAGLKFSLQWPRPAAVLGPQVVFSWEMPDSPYSFPSGHSAFAMLLASSLWNEAGRGGKTLLSTFVLWVGISRVTLGMHFPADVLMGYTLGAAGAWCAKRTKWTRQA
jgi:membrane-associated phospholipid phosphatase